MAEVLRPSRNAKKTMRVDGGLGGLRGEKSSMDLDVDKSLGASRKSVMRCLRRAVEGEFGLRGVG